MEIPASASSRAEAAEQNADLRWQRQVDCPLTALVRATWSWWPEHRFGLRAFATSSYGIDQGVSLLDSATSQPQP